MDPEFSLADDDINVMFPNLPSTNDVLPTYYEALATNNEVLATNSSWDDGIDDDDMHAIFASLAQNSPVDPVSDTTQQAGSSSQNVERTIPGPAGLLQLAWRRKANDPLAPLNPRPTQEYYRELVENPADDDCFNSIPWRLAMNIANRDGGYCTLGNIKYYMQNGKLENVACVIKSCTPNAFGDLTCMLKDTTGEVPGTINHKVLDQIKGICVGCVLVLKKVSVFQPYRRREVYNLNITIRNVAKMFYKDGRST